VLGEEAILDLRDRAQMDDEIAADQRQREGQS